MPSFTIEGRKYELITLDNLSDMELGELEILEEVGGLNVGTISDGVDVTVKLVLALVYISMLRSNPDATVEQARRAKVSVLEALAEEVANDVVPPTVRAASGRPASKNALASSRGK